MFSKLVEEQTLRNQSRLVGRVLRLVVGFFLMITALPFLVLSSIEFLSRTLLLLVALLVFYTAIHFLVTKYFSTINRWLGAVIANIPVILMFILGISDGPLFGSGEGQLAVITYVGLSLLIGGIKADPGCEVMSIPGLISGQHTHLACIVFSPIDWFEAKLASIFEDR